MLFTNTTGVRVKVNRTKVTVNFLFYHYPQVEKWFVVIFHLPSNNHTVTALNGCLLPQGEFLIFLNL